MAQQSENKVSWGELAQESKAEKERLHAELGEGGALRQFKRGIQDSMFGPLREILASTMMSEQELRQMRVDEEENKAAGIAGSIAGFMGGALTGTGLSGVLVGGGRAAAKGIGKGLGAETGKRAIRRGSAKLAGNVVGTGLEGGGIALSEATGKSAIDKALGIPGSGMQIADSVGSGLKLGAGAGVLGTFLPSAAGWLFRKGFSKRIEKTAKAMAKRDDAHRKREALQAQAEALEARGLGGLDDFDKAEYASIMGRAEEGVIRKGPGSMGSPALRTNQLYDSRMTKAMREVEAGDEAFKQALEETIEGVGDKARAGMIDGAMGAWTTFKAGPMGYLFHKIFTPSLSAAQKMIYKGIMGTPGARFAMGSSLAAGRPSLRKWTMAHGKMTQLPVKYDKYVDGGREFIRAMKVPPIQYLTNKEYQQVAGEIRGVDTQQMEMSIRAGLAAKGVPQEAATSMVQGYLNMLNHLQASMPQFHNPKWISHERTPVVPTRDRVSFSRTLRSTLVPSSILADFHNQELTREAADVWWQQHNEWAQLFADELARHVDTAVAYGRVFTNKEKEQLGLVTDSTGQLLGRTKQWPLTNRLQATYQAEGMQVPPAQVGGPKPPGDPGAVSGINQATTGPSAGLGQRLMER